MDQLRIVVVGDPAVITEPLKEASKSTVQLVTADGTEAAS